MAPGLLLVAYTILDLPGTTYNCISKSFLAFGEAPTRTYLVIWYLAFLRGLKTPFKSWRVLILFAGVFHQDIIHTPLTQETGMYSIRNHSRYRIRHTPDK